MFPDDNPQSKDLNFAITFSGSKIQHADHRIANLPSSKKVTPQNIKTLEGIATLQLPSNWFFHHENTRFANATVFRPSHKNLTQICYYGEIKPLDMESCAALELVIRDDLPTPRLIYSEAVEKYCSAEKIQNVKDLSSVFGNSLVGDNQLNVSGTRRPAFHVEAVRVETINGKRVVAVDGWFTQMDEYGKIKMNETGPVKRRYTGIFFAFSTPENATKIKEVYLLADDNIDFTSHKAVFRTALKSIEWK